MLMEFDCLAAVKMLLDNTDKIPVCDQQVIGVSEGHSTSSHLWCKTTSFQHSSCHLFLFLFLLNLPTNMHVLFIFMPTVMSCFALVSSMMFSSALVFFCFRVGGQSCSSAATTPIFPACCKQYLYLLVINLHVYCSINCKYDLYLQNLVLLLERVFVSAVTCGCLSMMGIIDIENSVQYIFCG